MAFPMPRLSMSWEENLEKWMAGTAGARMLSRGVLREAGWSQPPLAHQPRLPFFRSTQQQHPSSPLLFHRPSSTDSLAPAHSLLLHLLPSTPQKGSFCFPVAPGACLCRILSPRPTLLISLRQTLAQQPRPSHSRLPKLLSCYPPIAF